MLAFLATGHPVIPTTGDLDFTPLLYMAILLLAVRRTHIPFTLWVIPAAFFAGGLVDSISDGLGYSTIRSACILALVALLIPPRRSRAHPIPPPEV